MKQKKIGRMLLPALSCCTALLLCGCSELPLKKWFSDSSSEQEQQTEETAIDYGDAESFEAALNAGENLEGKVVRFKIEKCRLSSKYEYEAAAGNRLRFVSTEDPHWKEQDTVTVRATSIVNSGVYWVILYEEVPNAKETADTITSGKPAETEAPAETTAETTAAQTETKAASAAETTAASSSETTAESSAEAETGTAAQTDAPSGGSADSPYEPNDYFDFVEQGSYKTPAGSTVIICKVLGKQDITAGTELTAYKNGKAGESHYDSIILSKGKYNYFSFRFESDVSGADFKTAVTAMDTPLMDGERNAVEMTDYEKAEGYVKLTFKQTGDELGPFAVFKLLFYRGGEIVGAEESFFSVYADGLTGKGTEDTAAIFPSCDDFDKIEFSFEP